MKKLFILLLLLPCLVKGQIIKVDDIVQPTTSPILNPSVSSLQPFNTNQTFPSDPQTFTLSGFNLTNGVPGRVTVSTANAVGYELSKDGNTWLPTLNYDPASNQIPLQPVTVRVRIKSTTTGNPSGYLLITSAGAADRQIAVTGTVNPTAPTINVSTLTIPTFNYQTGTPPASQSYTVSGQNLTADVILHLTNTSFELSTDNNTFSSGDLTLPRSGTQLSGGNVTVYTRGKGSNTPSTYSGFINHNSTGATQQQVALNAIVTSTSSNVAKFNFSLNPKPVTGWNNLSGLNGSTPVSATDPGTGITLTTIPGGWRGVAETVFAADNDGQTSGTFPQSQFPATMAGGLFYNAGFSATFASVGFGMQATNIPPGEYDILLYSNIKSTVNNGITYGEFRIQVGSGPIIIRNSNAGAPDDPAGRVMNSQNNISTYITVHVTVSPGDVVKLACNVAPEGPGIVVWNGTQFIKTN